MGLQNREVPTHPNKLKQHKIIETNKQQKALKTTSSVFSEVEDIVWDPCTVVW